MRVKTALNKVTLTGAADHVQFLPSGLASNAPVVFTVKAVDCDTPATAVDHRVTPGPHLQRRTGLLLRGG